MDIGGGAAGVNNDKLPKSRVSATTSGMRRSEGVGKRDALNPIELRAYLGDGNYAGVYQRSDEEMLALWRVGVEETRAVIDEGWA